MRGATISTITKSTLMKRRSSLAFPDPLNRLKASGILLGLFTGKGEETTESTLKFHGILNLFDIVVTGLGVKNHKPHPGGVELVLNKLKVRPQNEVIVGDLMAHYKAGLFQARILSRLCMTLCQKTISTLLIVNV